MGLFVVACLVSTSKALPIDVQDQINVIPPGGNVSLIVDSTFSEAQTFTVGFPGQLSRVDLGVFRRSSNAGPLDVDIIKVVSSQPSFAVGDRLATQTIAASGIPLNPPVGQPFFSLSVDFSAANLQFSAGDQVGIALRSVSPEFGGYSWWESETNLYPGGHVSSLRLSDNLLITHGDSQFATFMLVPEPHTVVLLTVATPGFLLARRRRF
jgi:hypothetical protein